MRMIIAERHMQILTLLYESRGLPLRGNNMEEKLDLPTGSIYEYLKRLKSRGWVIMGMGSVKERITSQPFYTISPLGVSAMNYGIAERLEHE